MRFIFGSGAFTEQALLRVQLPGRRCSSAEEENWGPEDLVHPSDVASALLPGKTHRAKINKLKTLFAFSLPLHFHYL